MADGNDIDPNKAAKAAEGTDKVTASVQELLKAIEEQNKGIKNATAAYGDLEAAQAKATATGAGVAEALAGIAGTTSGLNKGIQNLVAGSENAGKMFTGFTKSLTTNFNAMAIGISIVEKMKEATMGLVYATDNALVSFNKTTGAAQLYGNQIMALQRANYNYGITIEEAAESQAALIGGIRNLKDLGPATNEMLLENTAILNELGVESGTTAQSLGFMINSLGMTEEAAASTTREMFVLAQSLGRPPAEMAEAFNAAAPQLAAFGNRAGDVFRKMAVNAAAANMEVADMLRITEQFDKFDTAASAVGKLNAVLGGPYLSTVRMVTTTDPTERLKMMSDAARQAGKSFDSMSYYERKMTASAMGLKDVNELALVMSNNFNLMGDGVEKSAADIVELRKQTQAFNSIAEEFSQIMQTFVVDIIGPIIKGLKMLANGITYLAQKPLVWMATGIGLVTAGLIALTMATGPIGPIIAAIITMITGLIVVAKGLFDMFGGFATVTKIVERVQIKFGGVLERVTKRFTELGGAGEGFFSMLSLSAPFIEKFINYVVDMVGGILLLVDAIFEAYEQYSEIFHIIGLVTAMATAPIWGPLAAAIGVVATAVGVLVTSIFALFDAMGRIGHAINVGMSPSLLSSFGSLADAVTFLGDALMFPFKMLTKLITGFKDLAGLLAGKALGFISSAISYVFGGSPSAEVNNGGFNRGEDMDAMAVSIGEEVAKAVKEALQGVQLNSKVELEVTSQAGLPTLFDYVQKNLDDVTAGRPPNYALNANRAGIG